jgi:RNA chaperone Hfq
MAKGSINIQDGYLFQALKSGDQISVQLTTGSTLEGKLKRFDRFAIVLEANGSEFMIYKHGIVLVDAGTVVDGSEAD